MSKRDSLAKLSEQCLFPTGVTLHCAVSGGADSSALLILASLTGQPVIAHHVDHGLRADSAAETERVQELASKVKAEFNAVSLTLEDGPNLEARARKARFDALPNEILTGHTADDQAETIILHLLRGGGLDALAAMREDRHPILQLRRADTEFVCEVYGWEPIEDPSNYDPRFRRNRIRHEILPLMNEVAQRDVVPLLTRAAKLAETDRDLLDCLAEQVDATDAASLASASWLITFAEVRRRFAVSTMAVAEKEAPRISCAASAAAAGITPTKQSAGAQTILGLKGIWYY